MFQAKQAEHRQHREEAGWKEMVEGTEGGRAGERGEGREGERVVSRNTSQTCKRFLYIHRRPKTPALKIQKL